MDLPRRGIDEDVILAWADASARLAAELRRSHSTPCRPELTLVRPPAQCRHATAAVAAVAVIYYPYSRLFHCACQWHLAFEIHPIFHVYSWGSAVGASIAWQVWDRLKPVTRGNPGMGGPSPLRGKVARVVLHHRRGLPPGDTHPVLDAASGV